ncbi:spindle assembly checkpoint component MAD1 [Sodiomyces alkalinus F11]|uniref:Spindle assembly checkpoint component MAD1 n=1 Tax=Sodiomyces alkalinus (strain CBS 110278 / VKM F-3762 / F11) TaxID=1314773 RepID=A0A3N2Q633_SODAK|nr:spindle assembly checkpoint component MAD1 [Sodiomyces alkalinus F11]ROT42231.1 spindle assembly checkpoint component MAD1 [Sodiomyces alkalinus F11]
MRSHTPSGDPPSGRSPLPGRFRASSGSALPRPNTFLRESRAFRATQPSYNIFTGTESPSRRPSSRQSQAHAAAAEALRAASRESSKENLAPADAQEYESQRHVIEELKAEISALRYTISTFDSEKQMADARHNADMEDQRRRAQADFAAKQAAESEKSQALRQLEAAKQELDEMRETSSQEKLSWERKIRDAEDEARLLQEQLEDLATAKDEAARIHDKKITDVEMQLQAAEKATREMDQEGQAREAALQQVQAQLAEKDNQMGDLEAEVLRLKAQTGDAETMAIIKKELSEQVTHIRTLESTNREQLAELKHLRQVTRAVEVVEEEKRSLQRKLDAFRAVEDELAETRMQRQRLEDERLAWTAYLKTTSESGDHLEFESPEAVARALVRERLTSASYMDKMGELQAELAAQESTIHSLETEVSRLKSEVEKAKVSANASSADKTRMRLERQRALAAKEVEYLRAQLKMFDAEDVTFQPEQFDEQRAKRIQELEDVVDQYKAEVQNLHAELSSRESLSQSTPTPTPTPSVGNKRPRLNDDHGAAEPTNSALAEQQLAELTRKKRKLQDEFSALQSQHALTVKELSVAREQVQALQSSSKTRVLALRSNPTSDYERVKVATLKALQAENAELLAHMMRDHPGRGAQSSPSRSFPTVPASQLAAARREVDEAKAETASAQKLARRLREVWGAKSAEFKEAVFSTMGWVVTFMPNGKMRVESQYYPSRTDEHENSIVFDGERGTMKVGGGPRSAFAAKISNHIKYWVHDKGCIPGFLAALTIEFYEEKMAGE